MGVYFGPTFKKDNLIFWIDATISSSYPGTGNLWYDLTGYNDPLNIASVTGVTYDTTYGKSFFFNGGQTLPINGLANSYTIWTNKWTVSIWALWIDSNAGFDNGYPKNMFGRQWMGLAIKSNGVGLDFYNDQWKTAIPVNISKKWYFFTFTYDNTTLLRQVYINGILFASRLAATTFNTTASDTTYIGAFHNPGSPTPGGNISSLYIYNRVLTDGEILMSFNTTKSKFSGYTSFVGS